MQQLEEFEDCEPVVLDVADLRAELRAGRMTGTSSSGAGGARGVLIVLGA
ncbi:MAG: hypothetical protein H0U28_02010 [Nocardioidaceae bacterium]|nr:hypothetical protein [Nocardioidaceae bacterium]